jgi:hypothetical protein
LGHPTVINYFFHPSVSVNIMRLISPLLRLAIYYRPIYMIAFIFNKPFLEHIEMQKDNVRYGWKLGITNIYIYMVQFNCMQMKKTILSIYTN